MAQQIKTSNMLTRVKIPLQHIYEDYTDAEHHANDCSVKNLSPDSLTIYNWMVEYSIDMEILCLPQVYCVNDTCVILKKSLMRYASLLCRIDTENSAKLDDISRYVHGTFPVCHDIVNGMASGCMLWDNIQLIVDTEDNPYSIGMHNISDLVIDAATYRQLSEIFSIIEESPADIFGTRNIWKNIYRMLLMFFADNILYGLVAAVSVASAEYSDNDKTYLFDTQYMHFSKAVKEYTACKTFGIDGIYNSVYLPGNIYINRLVPTGNTDTGPYRNRQRNRSEIKSIVCKTRHRGNILSHISRLLLEEIAGK